MVFKYLKFVLIFIICVSFAISPFTAYAQIPFGGMIVFYFPLCLEGTWLIIGPPTPMSLIYTRGSISFPFGPPKHVGQWLLGMASGAMTCTILVPCPSGVCPVVIGAGALILFHGSSI